MSVAFVKACDLHARFSTSWFWAEIFSRRARLNLNNFLKKKIIVWSIPATIIWIFELTGKFTREREREKERERERERDKKVKVDAKAIELLSTFLLKRSMLLFAFSEETANHLEWFIYEHRRLHNGSKARKWWKKEWKKKPKLKREKRAFEK